MIIKNKQQVEKSLMEEGSYPAYVVQIIDLGMQPQTDFETGEPKGFKPSFWFTFEFPTEMIEVEGEDKPRWQSKEFTYSVSKSGNPYIHEKSGLAKLITACGLVYDPFFDIRKLLKKVSLVSVGVTATGKNNKLVNFSKLPKGYPKLPELVNSPVIFDLDEPDMEVYEKFPKFLKDRIDLSAVSDGVNLDEDNQYGVSSLEKIGLSPSLKSHELWKENDESVLF